MIIKLGKNLYLKGLYEMGNTESNYVYPCKFPTIFKAYGKAIESGNWQSCTAINTPKCIRKFFEREINRKIYRNYNIHFNGLSENEHYELHGLIYAIADMANAYQIARFGNPGTPSGLNIINIECAKLILKSVEKMVNRANQLLIKINGLSHIEVD